MMKKIVATVIGILSLFAAYPVHAQIYPYTLQGSQGGTGYSTTTLANVGNCLKVATASPISYSILSCGGGSGSSFAFPFDPQSWGNSTSTSLGFLNGFLSTASSTVNAPFRLTQAANGVLATGINGLVYSTATGTVTCSGTVSCGAGSYVVGSNLTITGSGSGGGSGTGWASSTDDTTSIYFTGSGKVGIGTSTPSARLAITGTDTGTSRAFVIGDSANTERFTVLNNGNTGIGTAAPDAKLHVVGGNNITLILDRTAAPTSDRFRFFVGDGTSGFVADENYIGNNNTGLHIRTGAALATEPMTVLNTGFVGFGTTTPSQTLSVQGNGLFSGSISLAGLTATSTVTAANFVANSASATSTFAGGIAAETSGFVYDFSTNNVGIGTANPSYKLDVSGEINIPTANRYRIGGMEVLYGTGSGGDTYLGGGTVNTHLNGSGNVGINTGGSTPGTKLSVNGNAAIGYSTTQTGPSSGLIVSGNVGIGTTSPGSLLSVGNTGGINFRTGTSSFSTTGGLDFSASVGNCPITVAGICLTSTITQASAYKQASNYATVAVLAGTPTYSNGSSGVGATLTEVGFGALSVDSSSPSAGDRILVKNQASTLENGIYTVTATGSGIASYVLTRASDFDSPADVFPGVTTYIIGGATLSDESWTLTTTGAITIGTTGLTFAESSVGTLTAGTGITVSNNTVSVNQAAALSWTALQNFNANASTSQLSVQAGDIRVGGTATTTIKGDNATSTFSGGVQTTALNVTSTTATSTFANGIQLSGGCYRGVNGTCITASSGGSLTLLATSTMAGNDTMGAFTTISMVSGDKFGIIAVCSHSAPGRQYFLRVQNATGTSTLSAFSLAGNAYNSNALTGLYTASTTLTNAYVEIYDETNLTTLFCRDPNFLIFKTS